MDPTTLLAIVLAIGAVLSCALIEGLHLTSLMAPSAALLVVGGTVFVTIACFSFKELKQLIPVTSLIAKKPRVELASVFGVFGDMATLARREGVLVLENYKLPVKSTLLKRGIGLLVDGTAPELIRDMLTTELLASEHQLKTISGVWQTAGGFAPTLGIIGTVMGLVHVLGNLEDPSTLGPAIAVAFLATFYGIGSANLVFLPIAKKLTYVAKQETEAGMVIIEGLLSIQVGDSPRLVQEKLKSYIEEEEWSHLPMKLKEEKR